MVVAGVELIRRRQRQVVAYLLDSALSPVSHEHPQVQVVIYGVVVKFLSFDAVGLVFESHIGPVHQVEHLDRLSKQLVVDLGTLDDIQSQHVLQLHDELMEDIRR